MIVDEDILLPNVYLWKELIKFRAGYTCEDCGATLGVELKDPRLLHAHHVDGDSKNHRLSNGQCLCVICHNRAGWALNGDSIRAKISATLQGRKASTETKEKMRTSHAARSNAEKSEIGKKGAHARWRA